MLRKTYQDVRRMPASEMLFDVLYTFPRLPAQYARARSSLGWQLGAAFNTSWMTLLQPEVHFHHDVVVPDIAAWRRQRMPEVPDVLFFTLAPNWVCEVLSESTRAIDRSEKMKLYARERVSHLWFVDPIARTLEVFQLITPKKSKRGQSAMWNLLGVWRDDARVRAEPFDAIELELGSLWK